MTTFVTQLIPVIGLESDRRAPVGYLWYQCKTDPDVFVGVTHTAVSDPLQGVPQVEIETPVIRPWFT